MKIPTFGIVACCLFLCAAISAQETLTNADVVKMVSAGLSDQLVIGSIRQAPTRSFDLGADSLIELKKNKVSDGVIAAMMDAPQPTAAAGGLPPGFMPAQPWMVASGDPNDPNQPHDTGVYLDMGEGRTPRLVALPQPKNVGQTIGGIWKNAALMGLTKTTANYRVNGAHAQTRTSSTRPVFYFYGIDPGDSGLQRLKVKGDEREYVWMKMTLTGIHGVKPDVETTVTKVADGINRVTLNAVLKPGEYGFPAGFPAVPTVYEFGIDK